MNAISFECPKCGAPVIQDQKICEYCGANIMITSFNLLDSMPMIENNKRASSYRKALAANPDDQALNTSAAMCFLKLKQYDLASKAFEKAMQFNFDNSEVYFYAAVALLQGKIPFVHLRPTIDKMLSYLDSALMIEPRGIYYFFGAYIKYDYFKRKYLNVTPDYYQSLLTAQQAGLTELEVQQLFALLGTPRPACM